MFLPGMYVDGFKVSHPIYEVRKCIHSFAKQLRVAKIW